MADKIVQTKSFRQNISHILYFDRSPNSTHIEQRNSSRRTPRMPGLNTRHTPRSTHVCDRVRTPTASRNFQQPHFPTSHKSLWYCFHFKTANLLNLRLLPRWIYNRVSCTKSGEPLPMLSSLHTTTSYISINSSTALRPSALPDRGEHYN